MLFHASWHQLIIAEAVTDPLTGCITSLNQYIAGDVTLTPGQYQSTQFWQFKHMLRGNSVLNSAEVGA